MDGGEIPQTEARAGWPASRGEPALGREALAAWRETAAALRARAEAEGLSMGELAKRAGVPQGTLNPWYHGAYTGNYEALKAWLARDGGVVWTPPRGTARRMCDPRARVAFAQWRRLPGTGGTFIEAVAAALGRAEYAPPLDPAPEEWQAVMNLWGARLRGEAGS